MAVLNNYPYQLVTSALPAVAELRAGGDRDRLLRACQALGLGVMGLSGAMAVFLVAITPAFVPWWVGPDQYGGPTLTLLAVLAMVVRHFVFALGQMVFALGYDQRLAWAGLGDGVVTVSAMIGVDRRARPRRRSARVAHRRPPGRRADRCTDAVRRNRGDAVGARPVVRLVGGAVRVVLVPVAIASYSPGASDPVALSVTAAGADRLRGPRLPAARPRAARRLLVADASRALRQRLIRSAPPPRVQGQPPTAVHQYHSTTTPTSSSYSQREVASAPT